GYVYFGTLGGHVYGLRVTDGAPRWQPVVLEGAVRAGPVTQGQNLIVGTDAGRLYSIHKETGERDMVYDQINGGVFSRPAVVGDRLFVGAASGRVYALDVTRRDPLLWVYPPSSK
ncbi:MAG: PQQ-binding-like beta-propeller repeat protein, partial [Chloroflexi bacterium]|nr:PQQ-binding-like beta-propeller repeat protein [Chloroflexota bacterium]